jgi:flagellin-like hook-associated protein FlgL
MTRIFSGISRAPNLMMSRLALNRISQTNVDLYKVQNQLISGRAIVNPSDDPVRMATVLELDDRLERSEQRVRNITHAQAALNTLDTALTEAHNIGLDAKEIVLTQIGFGSSATERSGQAVVVQSMINSLLGLSNRESVAGYMFGASSPNAIPFVESGSGYRYQGTGSGLVTELYANSSIPITTTPDGIGGTSGRVRGSVDLNPSLTPTTKLSDLRGGRGLGVSPGQLEFSINGGPRISLDLSGAQTIADIDRTITSAISEYETENSVTVLGPGGVSTAGGSFSLDVAAGNQVEFFEVGTGVTARDLGLTRDTAFSFTPTNTTGTNLEPNLTWSSPVSALAGVTGPLGSIRVTNNRSSTVVDLSGAQTLEDVKSRIESSAPGTRVMINQAGTGIDVFTEVSSGTSGALSIEEVSGSNFTATRLGIRSFSAATRSSDLNFGKGVGIVDGFHDPVTGLADPSKDIDFTITLGDSASTPISIDLRPQDLTDIGSIIGRINSQIQDGLAAAGLPADTLVAGLSDAGNGIRLTQDSSFPTAIRVNANNNSQSAEHLGLLGATYNAATSALQGIDTAKVRVDGLFSDLIDLRDALNANDTRGIGLAGEKLEETLTILAEKRGAVGGLAKRVDGAQVDEEDRSTLDEQIRSGLRDVDFTAAASQFSLLQTQLQAGLQSTASLGSVSLLDFLS